jgi:short-subunit dehydrogenase
LRYAYRTALVTGASSGIGREMARQLAAGGCDLVLVARRGAVLEEVAASLRDRHGVRAEVLPADLITEAGLDAVAERLADPGRPVELLVNNAGFGVPGALAQAPYRAQEAQIQLNVLALVRLTHAALPLMVDRGYGGILNVSSVAAYTMLPGSATYAATKAFVTSFSQSLHAEVVDSGVHVTALCPGFTQTDFHDEGPDPGQNPGPGAGRRAGLAGLLWLQAGPVARAGLAAVAAGRPVCVPGAVYKTVVPLTRLVPRRVFRAAVRAVGRP